MGAISEWVQDVVMMVQYLSFILIYLTLGGVVLWQLEEETQQDAWTAQRLALSNANLTQEQWTLLLDVGLCSEVEPDDTSRWTFAGASFFSLTIVTTIGYGHMHPVTVGGKVFTMLYTFVGIAFFCNSLQSLTLSIVSMVRRGLRMCMAHAAASVGLSPRSVARVEDDTNRQTTVIERSLKLFRKFDKDSSGTIDREELEQLLTDLGGRVNPLVLKYVMHNADVNEDSSLSQEEVIDAIAIFYRLQSDIPHRVKTGHIMRIFAMCVVWTLAGAVGFSKVEGWTYFQSFWFLYISLTTIGLGDMYPTTLGGRWLLLAFVTAGLGLVSLLLTEMFAFLQHRRYWYLQNAYENNLISKDVLLAQGIQPLSIQAEQASGIPNHPARRLSRSSSKPPTPPPLPRPGRDSPTPPTPRSPRVADARRASATSRTPSPMATHRVYTPVSVSEGAGVPCDPLAASACSAFACHSAMDTPPVITIEPSSPVAVPRKGVEEEEGSGVLRRELSNNAVAPWGLPRPLGMMQRRWSDPQGDVPALAPPSTPPPHPAGGGDTAAATTAPRAAGGADKGYSPLGLAREHTPQHLTQAAAITAAAAPARYSPLAPPQGAPRGDRGDEAHPTLCPKDSAPLCTPMGTPKPSSLDPPT